MMDTSVPPHQDRHTRAVRRANRYSLNARFAYLYRTIDHDAHNGIHNTGYDLW